MKDLKCDVCGGSGITARDSNGDSMKCEECDGSGTLKEKDNSYYIIVRTKDETYIHLNMAFDSDELIKELNELECREDSGLEPTDEIIILNAKTWKKIEYIKKKEFDVLYLD